MLPSQVIHIEDIGPVLFERSRRAKNVLITVKSFKGVRVAFPWDAELEDAIKVAIKNTYPIQTLLKRARKAEEHFRRQPDISMEESSRILEELVEKFAKKYSYTFNRVIVKDVNCYWGSCSRDNDIILNAKILKLPADLRDYIILHELVHTKHLYHGRVFWEELHMICPLARELSRQLRMYC